ncbi:MAG: DNA polymerase III subunit beta [Candidatus Pacebacteria bacterium]|nr:DNA polymerase III subunit beta [Candidatus Paceibacterota bacterium]
MKIESTLEKISSALHRIQKNSIKNLSLPILENILLIAEDNTLTIRSTNLHVGTEIKISVKVEEKGSVAIKLDLFTSIINSIKNEHSIVLELKEKTLYIKTNKSEMEINIYPSDDFPTLPKIKEGLEFIIPIDKFIKGVSSVIYAASLSDIKPEISSVYIYKKDNELIFVATDSFRLAEKKIIIKGADDFPGVIIPVKNIQECIKVFNGIDDNVVFVVGKNQISITNENIYFTSRIIDGNYPDYNQIIPKEEKTSVIVLKNEIISSLRLINVFSDNFNQILLKTNSKKNIINISSRNVDVGENNTDIDAVISGEDIEMYLNHKYITDSFSSLTGDSLNFSFTEKNKPFILRSVGDASFLYLIMPMNR